MSDFTSHPPVQNGAIISEPSVAGQSAHSASLVSLDAAFAKKIDVSVVIPVYNEEDGLPSLFSRLYAAMDVLASAKQLSYEVVFINDGSRDRSAAMLTEQYRLRPDVTRVVLFNGNYGQHMAILAGFERTQGEMIITLDADLQNPPEEIGNIVDAMLAGHDYVGTIRKNRQDSAWRRYASRAMNRLREKITRIKMTDQGCMMRGFSRHIISLINQCHEVNTFIPALAYTFAQRPIEIEIGHEERLAGESKYSAYKLMRLNFDLVTGFSVVPLEMFSMAGLALSLLSAAFVVLLAVRRIFLGSEAEGVFTLFGILFFLMGVALFGIGLLGEYIGRIYQQVRQRPRFVVQAFLDGRDPGSR
jgi:undecaprenyl-phosphate 4-deoxy-4-formamido-L-arabinose transferase